MSRPLPQHALARRAALESRHPSRPAWMRHGLAAVGISVLGLAVAGAVTATGNAQDTARPWTQPSEAVALSGAPASIVRPAALVPAMAFAPRISSAEPVGRTAAKPQARRVAQDHALHVRTESLRSAAAAIEAASASIRRARSKSTAPAKALRKHNHRVASKVTRHRGGSGATRNAEHSDHASLPIPSGFRLAARFGQTGIWSRYHTGLDFAAPMGTTIHAVDAGVVTHAGSGSAGWAGHYVTIRHADGKTTLYAHLSAVSVIQGEHVSGGQRIGAVGMTGRTFGPHVHVELYPQGVEPGDVYRATDPAPWLRARGLHF